MSDDLGKRLRTEPNWMREDYPQSEAADALETQAARIAGLEAALRQLAADCNADDPPSTGAINSAARAALDGGKE